ncbi:MAG: EAL domain-containing protein [Lachnospiraceae bacterium]|nr:EAL domain-containing protein [Lachnospiraceae bacterium]
MQGIYYFELAALPVYLVLFVTTIYRRMTKGRTNVLFLAVIGSSFIAVVADLFGWINDNAILSTKFGIGFVTFSVYVYFITRNGINVAYLLFIFSVTRTWHRLKGFWKKALIVIPYSLILGMLATNEMTHAVFSVTPERGYARGEYILVLYVCAAFYMIFGSAYLAFNRRVLDAGERFALYLMYILNAVAIAIQLFFPAILLECFMTSITLLFIVLFVQRPEKQIDMNTHLPAFWAFDEEVDKIIATGQKVQIVIVGIRNAADIRNHIGDTEYFEYIHMISDAIAECAKENRIRYELYFEFPGFFYIILEDLDYSPAQACSEIKSSVKGRKGEVTSTGIRVDTAIAVVAFPDEIERKEELLWFGHNFIRFAKQGKVYSHAAQITEQREYRIETRINEILDRAIRDKRLEISYEPIWAAAGGNTVYAEAVLCLHDGQFGDIDNDMLYKTAGARGLTGLLEGYVTEQVFSYVASDSFAKTGYEYVVLRLSSAYGGQADYPDRLWNLRGKYNIHPEQICFAVDEPDTSDMEGTLGENMTKLSLLGYRFRYDGYGMGHFDLQNIAKLPFTAVRLDRRMIEGADSDQGRSILEGSIHLLKNLSLFVVAGNEDDEEITDMLCRMGCDYILGKKIKEKY